MDITNEQTYELIVWGLIEVRRHKSTDTTPRPHNLSPSTDDHAIISIAWGFLGSPKLWFKLDSYSKNGNHSIWELNQGWKFALIWNYVVNSILQGEKEP